MKVDLRGHFVTVVILLILLIPTVSVMCRQGIYSMHDFHVFRLFEYDKCVADRQLPCRWAPDSGLGYGEPIFNFYTQIPYIYGELFRFLGFSILDSTKIVFGLSLVLSALGMYWLSYVLWRSRLGALVSAVIYTYAPYRAVDVYVRGALPEALAFVYFPLATLFLYQYIKRRKLLDLLGLSLFFSLLVLTHNLSALMYSIFISFWAAYLMIKDKNISAVPGLIGAGIFTATLSAFYLLPVIFESKLVSLGQTTGGYYDYHLHFVTLKQLLGSRFWGYGPSVWGENDGLSLSVGQLQWTLPLFLLGIIFWQKKQARLINFFFFLGLGWLMLFFTHNKSTWLWEIAPPFKYIQFPWRFLGLAVFAFSLSVGAISELFTKKIFKVGMIALIIISAIGLNHVFFKVDRWFPINDTQFFSGDNYQIQISSSLSDFWPLTAKSLPKSQAVYKPIFLEGSGSGQLLQRSSQSSTYDFKISSKTTVVSVPIVYFPGWQIKGGNTVYPKGDLGLVTSTLTSKDQLVTYQFVNTPIRHIGNILSLTALIIFLLLVIKALVKPVVRYIIKV